VVASGPRADVLWKTAGLAVKVAEAHARGVGVYGSRASHRSCGKQDIHVSRKRVVRLMQEKGLVGRTKKKFVVRPTSATSNPIAPNLLGPEVHRERPQPGVGRGHHVPENA